MTVATLSVPLNRKFDGVMRIDGTRVTLDTVVTAFNLGATAEEIALRYPSLQLADVYAVIGYYLKSQSEVEDYLGQRPEQAALVREQNEIRFPPDGIRSRLLARRSIFMNVNSGVRSTC